MTGVRASTTWAAPLFLLALACALGACHRDRAGVVVAAGATFAELRAIKGGVEVTPLGESPRAPYPRERIADGESVKLADGGLAWIRRDAGALLLVTGPARLTLHITPARRQ